MTYNKPEVINVIRAVEAVQNQSQKMFNNVEDVVSTLPWRTSAAYQADE
jgi:hypothetical protein